MLLTRERDDEFEPVKHAILQSEENGDAPGSLIAISHGGGTAN
jgi:hypothetical protein